MQACSLGIAHRPPAPPSGSSMYFTASAHVSACSSKRQHSSSAARSLHFSVTVQKTLSRKHSLCSSHIGHAATHFCAASCGSIGTFGSFGFLKHHVCIPWST